MSLMISVITPSFNTGCHLERAITSVMAQSYRRWEHIVVDGGSTDGTLELLRKYDHLRWVSEPDDGQVPAMHKGFAMARGDVLVYLNADDFFFKKAFASAVKAFGPGVMMVVGQVRVDVEKNGTSWINDPRIDLESMLRHWEMNAYCYNPVGYFIRRELQDLVPFNADSLDKHDFEFLLEAVRKFPGAIVKVNRLFGAFNMSEGCKTCREQSQLDYWRPQNFAFVDRALRDASPEFQKIFSALRDCGYQTQTRWAIREAIQQGRAEDWARQGRLMSLPVDGADANGHMVFAEKLNHLIEGDIVVCVFSAAAEEGKTLATALRALPDHVSAFPVYHVRLSGVDRPMGSFLNGGQSPLDYVSMAAFQQSWKRYRDRLRWKFILSFEEPVSWALAAKAGGAFADGENDSGILKGWQMIEANLLRGFSKLTAIDLLDTDVEIKETFSIIKSGNTEVLVYYDWVSPEELRRVFLGFLGISFPDGPPNATLQVSEGRSGKKSLPARIRPDVLDQVYGSSLVRRFMTSEAVVANRLRWLDTDAVAQACSAEPAIDLAPYQLDFVLKILQHTAVAGRRILEIGSDNDLVVGRALVRLGARRMQCSNLLDVSRTMKVCEDQRVSFAYCDGRKLPFQDASFDLVIACALLEHLTGMESFARELCRILVPGGRAFLHGAPMWPSRDGHHVYFIGKGQFYKFNDKTNPVPDYGHLTMTPLQLAGHLSQSSLPKEDRDRIVEYVYEDEVLNRLDPDAVVAAFAEVFKIVEDFRTPNTPFPGSLRQNILDPATAAGNEVYTLELFLEKKGFSTY